ncbi:Caspase domain [seawater metagenome]|uniref:Caspase domain n=1 Tax=seawater metagenome TaxID=1561972 RepID=A0A5E8CJS1_9ZZZZ
MTLKKKLITIGLEYKGTKNALDGCFNDANMIEKVFGDIYDFKADEILSIRDDKIKQGSRQHILSSLDQAKSEKLDFLVFYYAGHGIQVTDYEGDEAITYEKNNKKFDYYNKGSSTDSALVTNEGNRTSKILDDELRTKISEFDSKTKILCIFDACHSGTIMDLTYVNILKKSRYYKEDEVVSRDISYLINRTKFYEYLPVAYKQENMGPTVICISAGRDYQYVYEKSLGGHTQGHFTYTLCTQVLRKVELDKVPLGDLIIIVGMIINNKKQIPMMSCSKPIDISNSYVDEVPLNVKLTSEDHYKVGSNDPVKKNFLSSLLLLLSRNENKSILKYFNSKMLFYTCVPSLLLFFVCYFYLKF